MSVSEETELAALVFAGRIGRILLGERSEIAARFQLGFDRLRSLEIRNENVARAHLLGLIEHRVVLLEKRCDLRARDRRDALCDGLLENELLAQDVAHVGVGQSFCLTIASNCPFG